jgi:hypothetical protein
MRLEARLRAILLGQAHSTYLGVCGSAIMLNRLFLCVMVLIRVAFYRVSRLPAVLVLV